MSAVCPMSMCAPLTHVLSMVSVVRTEPSEVICAYFSGGWRPSAYRFDPRHPREEAAACLYLTSSTLKRTQKFPAANFKFVCKLLRQKGGRGV